MHPKTGWALTCGDIDAALVTTRARGLDPGDVIEGQRVTPTGTVLRWRLTNNALTAGPIPFRISWGETPHPVASAPAGLALKSLHSCTLIRRASRDLSMLSEPTWRSIERRTRPRGSPSRSTWQRRAQKSL